MEIRENSASLVLEKQPIVKIRPILTKSLKEATFDPLWANSTRKLENSTVTEKTGLNNNPPPLSSNQTGNRQSQIDILA